jgi:hypothetical protein
VGFRPSTDSFPLGVSKQPECWQRPCTLSTWGLNFDTLGPAATVQILDDSYREMLGNCRNPLECIDLKRFAALVSRF